MPDMNNRLISLMMATIVAAVGAIGVLLPSWSTAQPDTQAATFTLCHTGGGQNCVVDGDTIWLDGEKVRIADIDTPETHRPMCPREAELGRRATERMHVLLNKGAFSVEPIGDRDKDRYGRKLRIVSRDGESLGAILVEEGLAREWGGRRQPWCYSVQSSLSSLAQAPYDRRWKMAGCC